MADPIRFIDAGRSRTPPAARSCIIADAARDGRAGRGRKPAIAPRDHRAWRRRPVRGHARRARRRGVRREDHQHLSRRALRTAICTRASSSCSTGRAARRSASSTRAKSPQSAPPPHPPRRPCALARDDASRTRDPEDRRSRRWHACRGDPSRARAGRGPRLGTPAPTRPAAGRPHLRPISASPRARALDRRGRRQTPISSRTLTGAADPILFSADVADGTAHQRRRVEPRRSVGDRRGARRAGALCPRSPRGRARARCRISSRARRRTGRRSACAAGHRPYLRRYRAGAASRRRTSPSARRWVRSSRTSPAPRTSGEADIDKPRNPRLWVMVLFVLSRGAARAEGPASSNRRENDHVHTAPVRRAHRGTRSSSPRASSRAATMARSFPAGSRRRPSARSPTSFVSSPPKAARRATW